MKTKLKHHLPITHTAPESHAFPINYQWTGADGVRCTGHTVSIGRNRLDAERRFFKQHNHVQPDQEVQ